MPQALEVPPVEASQVRDGLETLRAALSERGPPEYGTAEWDSAYQTALDRLHERFPGMLADRILWRATFLDSLLRRDKFQERHEADGELPTSAMLEVAATIPTYGDETSFDLNDFEERLVDFAGLPA